MLKALAPAEGVKDPVMSIGMLRYRDIRPRWEDASVRGAPAPIGLLVSPLVSMHNIRLVGSINTKTSRVILDSRQVWDAIWMAEPEVFPSLNLDGCVCPCHAR